MSVISSVPHVLRETSHGVACVSVYDEMLQHRELSLEGEVEPVGIHALCQHVRRLEALDPTAPITLFVDSPGGEVGSGLALFDLLRSVSCPVRTVCLARAASMGAVIFMAGDEREMSPHAELMVHDPLIPTGAGGNALSVQETSRRLMATRKTLTTLLSVRSGLSLARVRRLTAKDTYLSAERALELGFATTITPSRKER
ncbi:MAG TPA: ATP-dependent Clp protease proteolytic subunit [Candidatus Olsenella excrementigallinarum]|nr:ATP-dependent Clp protease proteolytic subunit [Candidatus Olsenella excrementigallinarum]